MSKKRVGVKQDMTPMVDIGFLLLTFFMLTTQFKPEDAVEVQLPESHSVFKLPDADVITISIGKDGKTFLGFDSQIMRANIFGEQNRLRAGMEVQPDIDHLGQMLIRARTMNPKLRTVIKSDKDTEYDVVERVMSLLQKVNITRFNLVTNQAK
ncbi:MAG TPA: biopolymer transporter ExbD [Bacteroidota bacterium]|nr:biopolymer transporter ExbD [Bacteroidota bacterium]